MDLSLSLEKNVTGVQWRRTKEKNGSMTQPGEECDRSTMEKDQGKEWVYDSAWRRMWQEYNGEGARKRMDLGLRLEKNVTGVQWRRSQEKNGSRTQPGEECDRSTMEKEPGKEWVYDSDWRRMWQQYNGEGARKRMDLGLRLEKNVTGVQWRRSQEKNGSRTQPGEECDRSTMEKEPGKEWI